MKNNIYVNRLLKLADLLDTLPPERFDFSRWVGKDWKGKPDLSCGTQACAFGWATTIPSLRKAGLILVPAGSGRVTLKHDPDAEPEDAGQEVFDLNVDEFEYLFTSHGYLNKDNFDYLAKDKKSLGPKASAQKVAARIREFVDDKYFARKRALAKLTKQEQILLGVE